MEATGGGTMSYLFKVSAVLLVLILQVQGDSVSPWGFWAFGAGGNLDNPGEVFSRPLLMAAEYVLIIALAMTDPVFLLLAAVLAFDLAAAGLHWPSSVAAGCAVFLRRGGSEFFSLAWWVSPPSTAVPAPHLDQKSFLSRSL